MYYSFSSHSVELVMKREKDIKDNTERKKCLKLRES